MDTEENRRRLTKVKVVSLLIVVLVITGLFVVLTVLEKRSDSQTLEEASSPSVEETSEDETAYEDQRGVVYYNGQAYYEKENLETLLILGTDKTEDTSYAVGNVNNEQADFIMLVVIDYDSEEIIPIQLNRDTMTEIQILGVGGNETSTFIGQLALAHTYGSGGSDSCINTKKAVSNLLYGVSIDHYLAMTMEGVALINDAIGGVTVTVPYDMTNIDSSFVEGEEITLTGELALKYVRTRQNVADGTNLARLERQRQYMQAFYNTLIEKISEDSSLFTTIYYQVADYLTTDCTVPKLTELFELLAEYGMEDFVTTDGENVLGDEYYEFYVDEDALMELVLEVFYEPAEDE
ncbi:MAG: LCP family protein [Lachnospiraceae bacterium]|nr:LCP family protein [Lachnospiraceae bacterium]